MRAAAGSAFTDGSIAQIVWRVVIRFMPSSSAVLITEQSKVPVNRALADKLVAD